jgi:putative FmdB family regulatory protein
MPIYAYRCRSCGVRFERYQTFTDLALRLCPECRKKTLQRIVSLVRIGFKGPGFYSTDNRSRTRETSRASAQQEQKRHARKEKTQPENASTAPKKTD